jgi:hypothetical protein
MDLLFDAIDAIDINEGGEVNAPELFEQLQVEEQQQHLPPLSVSIPFLDGKLEGVSVHYDVIPAVINWEDSGNIQQVIPIVRGRGKRQVPQSLLLDAATAIDKLVVTNWWRGLTKEDQLVEIEALQRIYRVYSSSNAKLEDDYWEKMRKSLESNPAAAAHIDDASNVYAGTADALELRKSGMECTVSNKVAKPKKRMRKVLDPATSPTHMYDRTARKALMQMENSVSNVRNVTEKPEGATFKEALKVFSVVLRNTGTPLANGKIPRESLRQKKPRKLSSEETKGGGVWTTRR